MIKKLIFDLDNTLIIWKDEYSLELKYLLEEYKVDTDYKKVDKIIDDLEYKHDTISKEILLNDINSSLNLNLDISFIDELEKRQSKLSFINNDLIDVLDYLSKKYELVILSNYFTNIQKNRLKNAKIDKYFTKVFGGDEIKLKPRPEAFLKAIYPNKKEECLMIGDSLKMDIEGALNVGLKVIAVDYFNKLPKSDKYILIDDIKKLKEIL